MRYALAGLTGYLAGSVSPAALLARLFRVDLRAVGSGNPGATNVGRALGPRYAVLVAVLDLLKGLVPAALFGGGPGLLAGFAATLGHVTSPWLRGRGGKGVATAGGAVLGSHPLWGLVVLAAWVAVAGATRWVALASVSAALALPACALVAGGRGDLLWAVALGGLVVARHRSNLRRWRENRSSTDSVRTPHGDPPAS